MAPLLYPSPFAINLYIAKTYGAPSLYPVDEEAKLLQWSFFAASDLDPWVTLFVGHRSSLSEAERSEALARLGEQRLQAALHLLDASLADRSFLLGTSFTIADLNVAAVLQPLTFINFDFSDHAAVREWLARSLERPAAVAARDFP